MNLHQLFNEVPEKAQSYTDDLFNLDLDDIPWGRAPQMKEIMRANTNAYDALLAARLLTSWGDDEGFDFLESFVCKQKSSDENIMPHRLRGYDDTLTQILAAFVKYWATKCDGGFEVLARRKIFTPIGKIISLSGSMPFEIYKIESLVNAGYVEYIPLLKAHLEAIIKNPKLHHWKVADCAHLLMKFDPEFVTETLSAYGYTLANFPKK